MNFRVLLSYLFLIIPAQLFAQNIEFIENQGQWDGPFKYKATSGKGDIYFEDNCFTYVINDAKNEEEMEAFHHGHTAVPPVLNFHAYKVVFEGSQMPLIVGSKAQAGYYNYFFGKDPSRWKSGIHPYYDIDYKHLYNGIDMHVSSEKGNAEYEFVVQPGADQSQILLNYKGVDGLRIKGGDLIISTSVGEMQEMKPYAYQYINNTKVEVKCNYHLDGEQVTFNLPEGYDHKQPLVIDPTIVFCTFTGSTADNWGFTATYDDLGNFYAAGIAHSTGYPVSTGAYQVTFHGGSTTKGSQYEDDIAIIKFNSTGTTRIYATYLGGSDNEQPHSLIVDANYNLIIAGRSYSSDFPVTAGAYSTTNKGDADIIISKLNATGTALLASTYVGGSGADVVNFAPSEIVFGNLKHNYGDDARSEVQIDRQGNIYVAASTQSTDFPTTNATQTILNGNQDAVIIKLNSALTTLLWSTYLGGSSDDAAYVLAFDTSQASIYVGGGTQSSNFPTTSGAYHATYQGAPADGWIGKFQNGGTYPMQKSTYIGTNAYDQVYGLQVDATNNVFAMGQTLGAFPVSAGVYSNAGSSQFIIKLDSNLSTNQLSTVYGSGTTSATNISPVAFLVDTCGNIYISGWGGNLDLASSGGNPPPSAGTTNMPITANAAQTTTDGNDFYFICLGKNMQSLLYATYFGSNNSDAAKGEHVDGGTSRFDKNGIVYQAICGGCAGHTNIPKSPFPTQPATVWSPTDQAAPTVLPNGQIIPGNCNEVALKIAFQFGPVSAQATPTPTSGSGCAPLFVQFSNTSSNGATYTWDFGDGSPTTTTFAPSHTYTTAGHYVTKLIVQNSNACTKLVDTAYINITVDTGTALPAFTIIKIDSCGPYIIHIANTSQHGTATATYTWDFGDGTNFTGSNPPNHTYSPAGTYTVTLTMTDPNLCTPTGTATQTLSFSPAVVAATAPLPSARGCGPFTVQFQNNSTNGVTYQWNFGDGTPVTTATAPTHTFTTAGTYTVKLVSTNLNSCNKTDSTTLTITVDTSSVLPQFTVKKIDSCGPFIISITNTSQHGTAAVVYTWAFGDGTTYTGANPPNHTYSPAGTYTLKLTMTDNTLCTPTGTAQQVLTFFNPVVAAASPSPGAQGCAPFAVQFQNHSTNGATYQWSFGDGSAFSTVTAPAHTYTAGGSYTVRLITSNPNSCNKADTAYLTIVVGTNQVTPKFSVVQPDSCAPYIAIFTDSSAGTAHTTYTWDFGDGTIYTGPTPPAHTYTSAGTYTVKLSSKDTTACNPFDTVAKTLKFNGVKVAAGFTANDTACINTDVSFGSLAANAIIINYYFSNGQSTTGSATSTNYQFQDTGLYTITQVVINTASCNGTDTFRKSIYIINGPVADFSVSPVIPVTNGPVTFTNLSTGATRYLWAFGDNTTSTDVNPVHMYNKTGSYNACLTAYNSLSCPAKICKQAEADILPLADLPTAFSPNGDGANDILYVRGAAIQTLDLLIFNRWGQLVFETRAQDRGWDGTFNGKPQEMDAYAYVLKVLFIDGSTLEKKGNVTLLR